MEVPSSGAAGDMLLVSNWLYFHVSEVVKGSAEKARLTVAMDLFN